MKKYYSISFVFVLVSILLAACGTAQNNVKQLEGMITISDVNSWLNLMPGIRGSFHISGEYSFNETDKKNNPTLKKINVRIGQEFIFSILPEIKNKFNEDDVNRNPELIEMQLFTNPGLTIDKRLLNTDKINLEFIFEINGIQIEKQIFDIELTRAY